MHCASMVYFLSVCGGMYPIVKKVNFTIAPSANPRISFPEVLTIDTGDSRYLSISAFASSDHNPIKVKTSPNLCYRESSLSFTSIYYYIDQTIFSPIITEKENVLELP